MIRSDYLNRVYAGVLGKCIGVRLGAPVEPPVWTYERIRRTYGEITEYIKEYRTFAADDDVNGPVFFIRALIDYARERPLTPEDIGNTWLNYTREGRGFFWWGGYGTSTEHTAYTNLKHGIPAPRSGSIEHNGETVAEQIGGQIFIDSWGLVNPGNPQEAARYAEAAASVSHDGNGIYGGRFIASAIAVAFTERDPSAIVANARRFVPDGSEYARVVDSVVAFHGEYPEDFRACRDHLERNFGYDRYPGVCHIIPNAGVCVLSLLYGGGDLSRTVEIATMCGWDTDCNAGNVGTIIGVAGGLEGVAEHYRGPINDIFVASSIAGSLNIIDLPRFSRELASLGYRLAGEKEPQQLVHDRPEKDLCFDFDLPGSTHGFRASEDRWLRLRQQDEVCAEGSTGALEILIDRLPRLDRARVYYKPFYRREDFSDERYAPAFSPHVYPGQTITLEYRWERWEGRAPAVSCYIRRTDTKEIVESVPFLVEEEVWRVQSWTLPIVDAAIDEIGIVIENREKPELLGKLYIDTVAIGGAGRHVLDFSAQTIEFGTITQCTTNGGAWILEEGGVHACTADSGALYTGNYYTRNLRFCTRLQPRNGTSHLLLFRARGHRLGYAAGLAGAGRAVLLKNDNGYREVASAAFDWRHGAWYEIELTALDDACTLSIHGEKIVNWVDPDPHPYGMYGFAQLVPSRTLFGTIDVQQLE